MADEGNGDNTFSTTSDTYTGAAAQTTAGLQKWIFANGSWHLAYTLDQGLNLGVPYSVAGYPTGNNAATGLPWAPATEGLRNITGRVNRDGDSNDLGCYLHCQREWRPRGGPEPVGGDHRRRISRYAWE